MRYRGGGVGHASTRDATNLFLSDRDSEELKDIHVVDDIPETATKSNDQDDGEADEFDYGYSNEVDDDDAASDEEGDNASDKENSEPEAGEDDNDVQEVYAEL